MCFQAAQGLLWPDLKIQRGCGSPLRVLALDSSAAGR